MQIFEPFGCVFMGVQFLHFFVKSKQSIWMKKRWRNFLIAVRCKKLHSNANIFMVIGMFNPAQKSQRTKQIALLIVFTALYVVLRSIPYSALIGGAGGFLYLSDFLVGIYGIILGPFFGGLSVIIGNFAAIGFGHHVSFFGLDFLPDLVAVVSIGFLFRRKWLPVVVLNIALLVIFIANPLSTFSIYSIPFAWLHMAAFIVLLSPLSRMAGKWIETSNTKKIVFSMIIYSFIGAMIQHLVGSILYEVELNQFFVAIGQTPIVATSAYPVIWNAVFFTYPLERLFLVVSAVLIGTPIILAITRNHFLQLGKAQIPKTETNQQPSEDKKT